MATLRSLGHRLFVRPSPENAAKVLEALDRFGFADHAVRATDLMNPNSLVQLGNPPNRIDLLTSITGVTFDDASESRVPGTLGDHDVYHLGLQALLANKSASGRATDAADVHKLRSIAKLDE